MLSRRKHAQRRGSVRALALLAGLSASVVVIGTGPPAGAAAGDVGYQDQSFSGTSVAPTADKPQSKLWFNAGSWWADMFDAASGDWHIFRLDRPTERWVDTGTALDDRANTRADVLWNGSKLYVASHVVTASSDTQTSPSVSATARLYRYSWTGSGYRLDAGFPTPISQSSSESLTIDIDSTGALWATWTQVSGSSGKGYTSAVYVNSSPNGGATWGRPFALPVAGNQPAPDDISAVVAYGRNRIGVLWSNQLDDTVYWAVHKDGAARGKWTGGVARRGRRQADDHINLKTIQADAQGRVVAAVKTSADSAADATGTDPQILLLVFKPATGSWISSVVGTISDCQTRPLVMLDETSAQVHVLMTAPTGSGCPYSGYPGAIYDKTANLDNPVFAPGRGTPVIRSATSDGINDATSTKQSVNGNTGLVVLASDTSTKRYWHADVPLGAQPSPSPSRSPSPSASPSPTASPTPTAAPGAVTVGGSTTATSTSTRSVTLTKPAGTTAGDVLVASFSADGTPTATPPTGWTSFVPRLLPGASAALFGYYRVVTAADAGTAAWTWTLSTAGKWNGGVTRFLGVDNTTPLDTAVSSAVNPDYEAVTVTVPGVTTTRAGARLIGGFGADGAVVTVAPPAGFAESWESSGQQISEQASRPVTTAGASGPQTWTLDQGRAQAGWLTALRPA